MMSLAAAYAEQDRINLIRFLEDIHGVVEANNFAIHALWDYYHKQHAYAWKPNNSGMFFQIGELAGMPVSLSLWTAVVNGQKILFWDMPSTVTDHRLAEKWLKKNLPKTAFKEDGRINQTDANNFHNVLR
jgi:hypothetical protein